MSWKLSLPCTRGEAEAIADLEPEEGTVLLTTEEDEAAGRWRLDAYFEHEPDAETIAAVCALAPGAPPPVIEALADADWVTMSQAGLEPLAIGRFVVHTAAFPVDAPPGGRAFLVDAGQAFGTGHHETTAGCMAMLDSLGGQDFGRVIDLGTGTGLLAFAARHLWPGAEVTATDIDAVAIRVTCENMATNAVDGIRLVVADGTRDPAITAQAPYDLIIANILAGPLIAMAPEIAAIAATGATIVLAGLLSKQFGEVASAYRACGCAVAETDERGDWTIVRLTAAAPATPDPSRDDRESRAIDR